VVRTGHTAPAERFVVETTAIHDLYIVRRAARRDERGEFTRLHCVDEFRRLGLPAVAPVQTNLSRTTQVGTVRGMHLLRAPANEHKFVTCLAGAVWDVAVDLRQDSPTRHAVVGVRLSDDDDRSVLLPPGVAHGFQALEPGALLLYQHTDLYRPELDAGVDALDPELAIEWPLPPTHRSERDAALPSLAVFTAMQGQG
jgi:dTDP-4-dehydrorhamnose 3,5-epimerase